MNPIRFGVIGAGHLGTIHTRLIRENLNAILIGVADPLPQARKKIEADFQVGTFSDYRDLMGKVDAAIIATPTVLHEKVAAEFIAAGVHVLIEKPVTQTVAQANRLIRLARQNQVVFQVGHVEQFNPTWLAARSKIQNPVFIDAFRCGKFSGRSTDISVVHDLMIHDVELILSLVQSQVIGVTAFGHSMLTLKDDFVSAAIQFASGCQARLTASRIHSDQKREMQVMTPSEQWFLDFVSGKVKYNRLNPRLGSMNPHMDDWSQDKIETAKKHVDSEFLSCLALQVPSHINAIAEEHHDFVRCIANSERPKVTGEVARDALALAEQIVGEIRRHPERLKTAA